MKMLYQPKCPSRRPALYGGRFLLRTVYHYVGITAAVACLTAAPAHSDTDNVALTVDIEGTEGNVVDAIDLTLEDLQALPAVEFDTTTIWTSGTQVFTGVRLATL